MQARYLGNFLGTKDPKYSLWQPFFEINEKYGREKRTLSAPPVAIRNETFIECKGLVATSCGNFSQEIPPEILKDFLLGIFECLKSSYPSNIIFPDELSIERGLMRKGTKTAPVGGDPQGNTIFLCGASILRAVADPLSSITSQYGVNVINKCIGGDFFKKGVPTGFPTSEKPEDAIIFHFLGNNMFSMKTHFLQNNRFHMQNPNFLNDKDINLLISKLAKLLTDVKLDFGGKIFLLGPFPRFLIPCCPDPTHSFPPSDIFPNPLSYCNMLNNFLARHPVLRMDDVTFIHYKQMLGNDLPCPLTYDGVHLTKKNNSKFANSLSQILKSKKPSPPQVLPGDWPSFTTWSACQLTSTPGPQPDDNSESSTQLFSEETDPPAASMKSTSSTADDVMDTDDEIESLYNEMVSNTANTESSTTSDDDAISSGVRDMLISKKSLLSKLSAWVQKNKR